jgi:sugar lactone lactonase YvrE
MFGERMRRKAMPRVCGSDNLANVAFGGADNRTLFITDSRRGDILAARMPFAGNALNSRD